MISKLGKEATKFFLKIMEMLGEKQHLKIDNASKAFMRLDVEVVSDSIETPWGIGKEISFAHYYVQNGDMMRDPEITFLFVDNRTEKFNDLIMVGVWPMSYTQDNLGIYRKIIKEVTKEGVRFDAQQSADTAKFCTQWFRNIKQQQKL